MTLSAIQTPILIIGSFLVLFLGLSALGDGNIATGWTEMMDHARSAMNVGADGHAYGANHMFHWTEADPMYQDYPGFWVFIGASIIGFWYWCTALHIVQRVLGQRIGSSELPSSVSGIGVPTSISYSVYLDSVKAKIMMW